MSKISDEQLARSKKAWTALGMIEAPVNAKLSGGEGAYEKDLDGIWHGATVSKGKPGADDQPAHLEDSTLVLGGQPDPRTGYMTKIQDHPIDKIATAGLHTGDMLEYRYKKKYERLKINPGLFGIAGMLLQHRQLKPIMLNFSKQIDSAELALNYVNQQKEQYQMMNGLYAAACGKSRMFLPGYEEGHPTRKFNPKYDSGLWHAVMDNPSLLPTDPIETRNGIMYSDAYTMGDPLQTDVAPVLIQPLSLDTIKKQQDALRNNWKTRGILGKGRKPAKDKEHRAYTDGGWPISRWGNDAIGLAGSIAGLGLYLNARHQRVSTPDFYRSNPTANAALQGLAGLRYDRSWINAYLNNARALAHYRNNNAGSLSNGTKHLANIATDLAVMRQAAETDRAMQLANIGLKGNYYDALMKYGTAEQQLRMAAAQANYNAYTASHNARMQQMLQGLYNAINAGEKWYKNDNTRQMYNRTYGLYQQNLDQDTLKILGQYDPDAFKKKLEEMSR